MSAPVVCCVVLVVPNHAVLARVASTAVVVAGSAVLGIVTALSDEASSAECFEM